MADRGNRERTGRNVAQYLAVLLLVVSGLTVGLADSSSAQDNQTITMAAIATVDLNQSGIYSVNATTNDTDPGATITYTVDGVAADTAGCTVSASGDVNFSSVGTCTIDANSSATANFDAAGQVQQVLTIVVTDSFGVNTSYTAVASAGTSSVPSEESFNGTEGWSFEVASGNHSAAQSGAQMMIDTSSTSLDISSWNFTYLSPNSGGGFGITSAQCPSPSTFSETCPPNGYVLPPGGDLGVEQHPGVPATLTSGYDSSYTVGSVGTQGDAAVTTSVTLNDPRYETPNGNEISVWTFNDNADESSTPQITANGSAILPCPQPLGTVCAEPVEWATYNDAPSGSGNTITCNTVLMQIEQVPYSGAATPYQFTYQENEEGTGGCPIGNPGIYVGVSYGSSQVMMPCTSGTNCSVSVPISGLGDVTASVGPGQGVAGFNYAAATVYFVVYPASNASPPAGAADTAVGSSTSPTVPAAAAEGSTTATATGGEGVLLVSQFNSNPVNTPPLGAEGEYFDVQLATGSTFTGVTIMDCNTSSSSGGPQVSDTLDYWNGTDWVPVEEDGDIPVTYTGSPPCATFMVDANSVPSVSELTGTMFAVVTLVAQAKLVVTSTSGAVGNALKLTTSGGSGTGAVSFRVTGGTASGCAISNGALSATSTGTCLVIATKAADATHNAASSKATTVTFTTRVAKQPEPLTVPFAGASHSLSASAKLGLSSLAKKLVVGASVTITGYAKGNSALAKSRARSVAAFLSARVTLHVNLKTVTNRRVNEVTVTTTKE